MWRAILGMSLACALSVGASARELDEPAGDVVSFTPALEAGWTSAWDIEWALITTQRSSEWEGSLKHTIRYAFSMDIKVVGVEPGGQAFVSMTLSRLGIRVDDDAGGMTLPGEDEKNAENAAADSAAFSFLWKTDADGDAEASDDVALALGRAIAGATFRFEVAPDGRVISVRGFDVFEHAFEEQDVHTDARVRGPFTEDGLAAILGHLFQPDSSGVATRAVGSAWRTTKRTPIGARGVLASETRWSLADHAKARATLGGTETFSYKAPRSIDAAAPTVTLGPCSGETTAVWDTDVGALWHLESAQHLEMTFAIRDVNVMHTSKRVFVIERRDAVDADGNDAPANP